ncbi:MAG: hypothetical protein ABJX94_15060 [Flavobacteriaceae bacterium]
MTLKGGFDYTTGNLDGHTYVTINCDGVEEMSIHGEVQFSRNLILPIERSGEVNESKTTVPYQVTTENGTQTLQVPYRVKGGFVAVASDWNDILVEIDLVPFVRAEKRNGKDYLGNFQFHVNKAVLDFSDLRNAPGVVFPQEYHNQGLLLPEQNLWRGVYVNTLDVRLPQEFMTEENMDSSNSRVGFGAHHLIIDSYGVSGTFYADNLFTMEEGRTNKKSAWAYSLDHLEVTFIANNFIGAEFDGRILLPITNADGQSDKKIGLGYVGLISQEECLLNVRNDSVIDFSLWKAKAELLPNSSIELKVVEGQFRPKAVLHGNLALNGNLDSDVEQTNAALVEEGNINEEDYLQFEGIRFQGLVLQTETPVFSVDYMGYEGEIKMGGFPASISNIGVTANEQAANLYFDLSLNLMGENNSFAAQTSLAILGEFQEAGSLQKWKFKGIDLDAIALEADMGAFTMTGSLTLMNDDPEYGNGFAASLEVEFEFFKGLKIGANGIFGNKDFRYWQFDAMVDLPPGAGTGVLNLDGFGGGASYKMRRNGFSSSFSPSGLAYVPDKGLGLGVKAMIMFNGVKKEVIKGGAGFEVIFNKNGGVNFMGLYGQATFMNVDIPGMDSISGLMETLKENTADKDKFLGVTEDSKIVGNLMDKAKGDFPGIPHEKMKISADVAITYDFQNNVLHGELDAYVNVPGGFVTGRGSGGRAGWAVLHFASDEWYIYIGTPEDRVGLKIGVAPLSIETGGYFMVGSRLPGSPPPPPIVAEKLGVDVASLDYMRDENALESGGGFAFGADFSIDTGDLQFLIFYARFQAGAGFDIMLRDYGKAKCANTGDQVGINGWYANGEAYVYLQGELGVNIKLFFVKKKIPIIKGSTAALLEAKGPNPFWMRGYLVGELDLLGGLVKGSYRFKLTIGEECEFMDDSPLGGIKIITDLSPDDNAQEMDVFAIPQASFSMRVGEPIVIPEDDGDKTYKIVLEKFVLEYNGQEIQGALEWNGQKDRANFVSTDILPPESELTAKVEVSFMEKIGGIFRPISVDGKLAEESMEHKFTTGGAPDVIPLHNITHAYPIPDQKNFYEKEYDIGYIQLKRGQDYLFDNTYWQSDISYNVGNDNITLDFQYHTTDNKIIYDLPNVNQSKEYRVSIVSRPKNTTGKSVGGSISEKQQWEGQGAGNSIVIEKNTSETISKDGEIERLGYTFSSSAYKTFKLKINAIRTNDYNWGKIYSDVIYLSNRIDDHEPFDLPELMGNSFTADIPLVAIEAVMNDTYYQKDMAPFLYNNYPLNGRFHIDHRDVAHMGVPPKRDLPLSTTYLNSLEYGINEELIRTTFPFRYNLGLAYKQDWNNMQSIIVNTNIDGGLPQGSAAYNFLDAQYTFMRFGYYNVSLQYVLPGGILGTRANYRFKNPNAFR